MPQYVTLRPLLQNKERSQGYGSDLEATLPTKVQAKFARTSTASTVSVYTRYKPSKTPDSEAIVNAVGIKGSGR
jgi:hypothetical protein